MRSRQRSDPTFEYKTLLAAAVFVAAVLLVLGLRRVPDILLVTFAGVMLAVFLYRVSSILAARTPLSRRRSLLVVVVALLALVSGAGLLAAPTVIEDLRGITDTLPQALASFEGRVRELPLGDQALSLLAPSGAAAQTVGGGLESMMILFAYPIIILFVGIYVAYDPGLHWNGLLHLVPPARREKTREVLIDIGENLWWWILGRLLSMAAVGVVIGIGLFVLRVPAAGALGLLAGLLDFIPNIGPILAFLPGLLLALTEGGASKAFQVGLLYLLVQTAESTLLTPNIDRRTVEMPPALVILGQALMGVLFGGLGVLLATPLMVCAMVIVRRIYVEEYVENEAQAKAAS